MNTKARHTKEKEGQKVKTFQERKLRKRSNKRKKIKPRNKEETKNIKI